MLKETLSALDISVTVGGAVHKPTLKPGDMVRFEQHFGRSLFAGADPDNPGSVSIGFTELLFLAFTALRREGKYDGDFDSFVDVVDDLEVGDTAGKAEAPAGTPSPD